MISRRHVICIGIISTITSLPQVNPLVKSFPAVFLSEIIFTTLIIVCHMYSSRHSALAQQESLITVSHHEQQCLSVGFANTAALIAVRTVRAVHAIRTYVPLNCTSTSFTPYNFPFLLFLHTGEWIITKCTQSSECRSTDLFRLFMGINIHF